MTRRLPLLLIAIAAGLLSLAGCRQRPAATPEPSASQDAGESADQFVARINAEYKTDYPETAAAQWLSSTYISVDSQRLAAHANQRALSRLNDWIAQAKYYEGRPMSADSARALKLLKSMSPTPAPRDRAGLSELTILAARMEGEYGAGRSCEGSEQTRHCAQLGELEQVLANSRDYQQQLAAWQRWHAVVAPMRRDYTRFVELSNAGARDAGFADVGELWRSGYDMPPAQLRAETERLWQQVRPLYAQLQCYARNRLDRAYGADKGELPGRLLPAHLLGNMWQQDWSNLWDLLQPYPGASDLDITATLQKQYQGELLKQLARAHVGDAAARFQAEREAQLRSALRMTARAQAFYTSLGMPPLPPRYWQRSQFIKPLDRDVVCHASAWDMNLGGDGSDGDSGPDLRTKMCIQPTEEDFTTIHHELGHLYYDLAYHAQPPLFQAGANDAFHEAIGDTVVLAMTPDYLHSIGLIGERQAGRPALINAQMRMALSKIAFLPFGLVMDRWRWGVFDGSIPPERYNQTWWALKAHYQGVAPVSPRGEQAFDPGAKYHVPANVPYTRYFLAYILQFQLYQGLCAAAGHTGPLYECSFHGNREAGRRLWALLQHGARQPWQATLKELTGSERIDAVPLLEYFAPISQWLQQQNRGRSCDWQQPSAVTSSPSTASVSAAP